ncbi:MAG: 4Fe-4S dicluster domain-containing protein [Bacteroidales bacterium]|nr:4Fe-4S dicluster domain-containing protein [Bacteroidales bacterium]
MRQTVNTKFKQELKEFGVGNWNACFNCGNCTAICGLTENGFLFPRKSIQSIQMGLKENLEKSVDPWLCYYCGECSDTCPRDANPGELMMSLRRYLTSTYDWTGLSKKFYTSKFWEIGFIAFFGAAIIAAFLIFLPPSQRVYSNPEAFVNDQGGVMINSMVDGISSTQFIKIIEYGDWTMAIIVALLLISNIFRMFYKVILKDKSIHIPFFAYFTEFFQLIYNFLTQARFSKCEKKSYWVGHLLLMTGYTIMFMVIVVLLPEFQIEEVKPWYHWQRILGYYATFGILYFLIIAAIERLRKSDIKFKFSHESDWLFIIMLGLTTITGILINIFRLAGMPVLTYYMFVLHLAILVPMIIVEVPFSKWSHLAYRPFAIYFAKLKKASYAQQAIKSQLLTT